MRSLIGFVRRMEARVVGDGGGDANFAVVEFSSGLVVVVKNSRREEMMGARSK